MKARGVAVPPRGSVQDKVLIEVIERERYAEFHKTVHTARLVGLLMGSSPSALREAEDMLELAIFQTAFNPEAIRKRIKDARTVANKFRNERHRDSDIMAKVASYTVKDPQDEAASKDSAFPTVRKLKTIAEMVQDPWTEKKIDG